jgi:hypothetical protein
MVKSRRMRRSGHVAPVEEINVYTILIGKLEGEVLLKGIGVDGRIILT